MGNPEAYSTGQVGATARPDTFRKKQAPKPNVGDDDEERLAVATALSIHAGKLQKIEKALKGLGVDIEEAIKEEISAVLEQGTLDSPGPTKDNAQALKDKEEWQDAIDQHYAGPPFVKMDSEKMRIVKAALGHIRDSLAGGVNPNVDTKTIAKYIQYADFEYVESSQPGVDLRISADDLRKQVLRYLPKKSVIKMAIWGMDSDVLKAHIEQIAETPTAVSYTHLTLPTICSV